MSFMSSESQNLNNKYFFVHYLFRDIRKLEEEKKNKGFKSKS